MQIQQSNNTACFCNLSFDELLNKHSDPYGSVSNGGGLARKMKTSPRGVQQTSQTLTCGLLIGVMKWTEVLIKRRGDVRVDSGVREHRAAYVRLWTAWLGRSVCQGNTLYFPRLNNCICFALPPAT